MTPTGPSRQSGNEIRFKTCPSCGHSKWAVSMSVDTEAWTCYACGAGGGGVVSDVEALRRRMRPSTEHAWPEVALPPWSKLGRTATKYLRERGILRPEKYGIVELTGETRVLVPYFGDKGQPIFWTTRYFVPDGRPKYVAMPGRKPLYVLPEWKPAPQTVIVEGPFDALAVAEWPEKFDWIGLDPDLGFNVIALGGKTVTQATREDLRTLAPGLKIIMLDGDAALDSMKLRARMVNAKIALLDPGTDPAGLVEVR